MVSEGIDNIPIVDATGQATGVLRALDVIHFLAEAFPEELLNLPPEPHQTIPKPEGPETSTNGSLPSSSERPAPGLSFSTTSPRKR